MYKFYCNGKKGFCDTFNGNTTANCFDCIHHDYTGGGVVEFNTQFDRIKNMDINELAEFIKSMVDENEVHDVACYGCIHYGTHHSDPHNKGTNLYECEGCSYEGIGHDIVRWLESEVTK